MNERVVIIVNSAATRVGAHLSRQIVDALRPHGLIDVLHTGPGIDAGELAEQAAHNGATVVVGVGGDGTISAIAGTLAGGPVALLPVAAGGTNVFARAMGWPHPACRALPLLAPAVEDASIQIVHMGRAEYGSQVHHFCVNAGIGIDAGTVRRIEGHPRMKQTLRQAGFGVAALQEMVRTSRRPHHLSMHADGADGPPLASLVIAVGSPYAFFGRRALDLTPGACFDGRLRWMGLERTTVCSMARAIRGGLHAGAHIGTPGVHDGWAQDEITVRSDDPVDLQADGEPLGAVTMVRIRPGPRLRVVSLPRPAAY